MKAKLIPFLLLVVIAISCKKTETKTVTNKVTITDTVTATESPLKSVITQQILLDSVEIDNGGPFEQGNTFYSSEDGVISKLGLISPVDSTYKVTLWDATADTVIVSANVHCTDSLHFFYTAITPVHILANTLYLISANTAGGGAANNYNFYYYELQTGNPLAYPYAIGDITFTSCIWIAASGTVYPTNNDNYELGDADFVFKADSDN
jgi:hypothetical protein